MAWGGDAHPGDDEVANGLRGLGRPLPWRPDRTARARKVARQRPGTVGVAVGGAVVSVVVTSVMLLAGCQAAAVTGTQPGSAPPVSPAEPATPHPVLALPAPGAAGFPVSIYPPPLGQKELNLVGVCPDPAGLQQADPGTAAAALTVIRSLGLSFRSDLSLSDKVYWPQALTDWQMGLAGRDAHPHVLYSGPLLSYHQRFGPPDMSRTILAGCGGRVAHGTWMIVTGQVRDPALQGEFLLLDRRGRELLWNAQ
jgi:hypothetical protein